MINDHNRNLCTLNKQNDQRAINPFYDFCNNGSRNTVESYSPKLQASALTVLQRSKQKPRKNICFWFCRNVGSSVFKYETKTNYHSQNMSKCLCMHISYFGGALVLDFNTFSLSQTFFISVLFISVPVDEQGSAASIINNFIYTPIPTLICKLN